MQPTRPHVYFYLSDLTLAGTIATFTLQLNCTKRNRTFPRTFHFAAALIDYLRTGKLDTIPEDLPLDAKNTTALWEAYTHQIKKEIMAFQITDFKGLENLYLISLMGLEIGWNIPAGMEPTAQYSLQVSSPELLKGLEETKGTIEIPFIDPYPLIIYAENSAESQFARVSETRFRYGYLTIGTLVTKPKHKTGTSVGFAQRKLAELQKKGFTVCDQNYTTSIDAEFDAAEYWIDQVVNGSYFHAELLDIKSDSGLISMRIYSGSAFRFNQQHVNDYAFNPLFAFEALKCLYFQRTAEKQDKVSPEAKELNRLFSVGEPKRFRINEAQVRGFEKGKLNVGGRRVFSIYEPYEEEQEFEGHLGTDYAAKFRAAAALISNLAVSDIRHLAPPEPQVWKRSGLNLPQFVLSFQVQPAAIARLIRPLQLGSFRYHHASAELGRKLVANGWHWPQ